MTSGARDTTPVQIFPVDTFGEIVSGDDLAALLGAEIPAAVMPAAGDVLVVTSKIVSKAEGRFATLAEVVPGPEAERIAAVTGKDARLVELVLAQSSAVVRAAPQVLITRHRLGLVLANAGIDQSNLGPNREGQVLLLPIDPDATAAALRAAMEHRFGVPLAVVISDSFGRPWRHGVVNVAIGASGLAALHDRRGEPDRDGRTLEVTQVAVGDMIATAAGLVCGEGAESVPVALVRGYRAARGELPAAALVRPAEQDLFR